MTIYIFADMEGISGISSRDFVLPEGRNYERGRRFLTEDINACIRGCFSGGADRVTVRDGHSFGNHVLWEELDSRAELIQGQSGDRRMPGLDECAGLILLGYHAMAGTQRAFLEHTYSSQAVQNLWLNNRLAGEIGVDAAIAGEQGVPVLLACGDHAACAEAENGLPQATTCTVKEGLSCEGARLLPMAEAHARLESCSAAAVARLDEVQPWRVAAPVTMRIEWIERHAMPNSLARPDLRIVGNRMVEATADTVEEALRRLF